MLKKTERIKKSQDEFIDGNISSEDCIEMKTRNEAERSITKLYLKKIKVDDRFTHSKLNKCYKVLSHLDELYENADYDDKKRLMSLIFSKKIIFDGKKSRTLRMNEVLHLLIMTDKGSGKIKTGLSNQKTH